MNASAVLYSHRGVFIASCVIVAVCYFNSVPNDFILDDYQIVAVNPAIRTVAPLQLLKTPYWGENSNAGIYRPLTIFSFSLEYPLWHRWAGGYRLLNLLLHAINGFLVFVLARSLLGSAPAAYAATVLYLVHPVHTEPVVGLAGRSELLAATFFLLAWILFRQERVGLCSIAFVLSLLSKENAITFPAVVLLDTFVSQGGLRKLASRWKGFVLITCVAMSYLGMRMWVLGGLGVPKAAQYLGGDMTIAQRELTSGRAFLKYCQLLIAPIDVTGDYDFNSIPVAGVNDWLAWTGLLLVAIMIVFALQRLKEEPEVGFAVLFFFTAIFPTSNWVMPTTILMSERALYLPSLGICLLAGFLWMKLPTREIRGVVAVATMAAAVVLCVSHNYVWRNDLTYFENMVRVLPDNLRGRQGYGVALVEVGRPDDAREQFEAGLKIRHNAPLLVGLGEAYMQIDRGCGRARPALEEAVQIDAGDPFARWLLGGCFEKDGLLDEAETNYREAIRNTQFPDPKLLGDWARVLGKTGRTLEAEEAYRRAALLR